MACPMKIYHCFPARRFPILCWLRTHRLRTCSCTMAAPGGSSLSSSVSQAASFNLDKPQNESLQVRAGTASFGVISQHSNMFAFSEALSSGSWGDRAHGVGQHLVAVALGFWGWSSIHRVVTPAFLWVVWVLLRAFDRGLTCPKTVWLP